jgi:hypothetical protein
MMDVTTGDQPVPDLYDIDGIDAGSVYIARWNADHSELMPDLADGESAVLSTGKGRLELTTRHAITGVPGEEGTYLNLVDLTSLTDLSGPRIRRYTWRDTFAKVRSAAGIALLLPGVIGFLAAAAGLFFLLSSQNQPSNPSASDSAVAVVAWAAKPGNARTSDALSCLLRIEGRTAATVTIPGVTCAPPDTPWWQSATVGAVITAITALLTALVSALTLPGHFRFGKKPAAG